MQKGSRRQPDGGGLELELERVFLHLSDVINRVGLYPKDHPSLRGSVDKLHKQIQEAFERVSKLNLMAVGDKLILNETMILSEGTPLHSFSERLERLGVDEITLLPGLSRPELEHFIYASCYALKHGPEDAKTEKLQSTPNLRIGRIVSEDAEAGQESAKPAAAQPEDLGVPEVSHKEEIIQAREFFSRVGTKQLLRVQVLERVIELLSVKVTDHLGVFMPLAKLKSYDEYTYTHAINVSLLTMAQANLLGCSKALVHDLGVSALLHDIGKTTIPDPILNKPGRYNESEYNIMKAHPVNGAKMLFQMLDIPRIAIAMAYEHHICYDQKGYPPPRRKRELHVGSHLCHIADVYDAMRTNRPYRPGMPIEKIISIMERGSGSLFEPTLLKLFLREVAERDEKHESRIRKALLSWPRLTTPPISDVA